MEKISYRLADYEIIELSDGEIWWKTHTGFGSSSSGKCFIEGRILFISHAIETEESSFLKNEFLQYLRSLRKWEKTQYYCVRYEIHKCSDAVKKIRTHRSKAIDVHTPMQASSPSRDADHKPLELSGQPPDDFDLYLQSNIINLSEISSGLVRRFESAISLFRKLRFRK